MPAGRPRTSTPPPDEMIKLGEEMLSYVSDKSNNVLHLSAWWSVEKFITKKVWDNMTDAPEFSPYYEQALRIIGLQYLDKNSNVREGASHRWQRIYFKDLKDAEDKDKKFEAELGNISTQLAPNQSVIDQASIIMKQQNEIEKLKAIINAGQSETSEIILGSDTSL